MGLYQKLVNKHDGIRIRYHHYHDGSTGAKKYLSWLYLLWLNIAYYMFFCRFLGKIPNVDFFEKKHLLITKSETIQDKSAHSDLSVDKFVGKLKEYEVISFDIFDTLIFRSVAQPTDVFYFVGEKMDIMDFKNIRSWAEWDARMKCNAKNGHMEIDIQDIWENLAEDVGCDARVGMQMELDLERSICYANPFMLSVW